MLPPLRVRLGHLSWNNSGGSATLTSKWETVPGATVVAVSDYVAAAADETAAKYGIKSYGNDCDGMIKDPEVERCV